MTDLWQLSARELTKAFANGDFSPGEALEACLDRIAACDPEVGAFTSIDEDRARAAAAEQSARYHRAERVGPLAGVPVAVKELIEVEGLPFTGGSNTRSGSVGRRDASVVRTLREAGAIIIGTTRTHELAWGITTQHESLGNTHNPWRLDRIPGGSSGGSAAAVAYGGVPVALGTDTGGSVRIPAGFCGVVGFKPTYGLAPMSGVLPLAPSFDHVGVLTREVVDARVTLDIPPASVAESLSVATPEVPSALPLSPAVEAALAAALEVFGGARTISLPDPVHTFAVFSTLQAAEALAAHREDLGTWPSRAVQYGQNVRSRLEYASNIASTQITQARAELAEIRRTALHALEETDLVVQPCAATGPSTTDAPDVVTVGARPVPFRDAVLPCTVLHNLAGLPSCAVPVGLDELGMPIGVQVTASPGNDGIVLAAASVLRDSLRDRLPDWPTGTPISRS